MFTVCCVLFYRFIPRTIETTLRNMSNCITCIYRSRVRMWWQQLNMICISIKSKTIHTEINCLILPFEPFYIYHYDTYIYVYIYTLKNIWRFQDFFCLFILYCIQRHLYSWNPFYPSASSAKKWLSSMTLYGWYCKWVILVKILMLVMDIINASWAR